MPPLISLHSPFLFLLSCCTCAGIWCLLKWLKKNRPCVKSILQILEENICLQYIRGLSNTGEFRLLMCCWFILVNKEKQPRCFKMLSLNQGSTCCECYLSWPRLSLQPEDVTEELFLFGTHSFIPHVFARVKRFVYM